MPLSPGMVLFNDFSFRAKQNPHSQATEDRGGIGSAVLPER